MKKIIFCFISLTLWLPLSLVYAAGPDAATQAFIEEFGIEEAQQPISASPHWRKPTRIIMSISSADLQARPNLLDWVKEVADDVEIVPMSLGFGQPPDPATIRDLEVYLGYCTPGIVRQGVNLRWLQHYGVGLEECTMLPEIRERDFLLTNNQHYSAPPIAEHVIAMMMMLTRNLTGAHTAQLAGRWDRGGVTAAPMIEVKDKTMLVAGLGGIGTEVARRAAALGMRVTATRNSSRAGPDFVAYVGLADELNRLAAEADIIVNALPLTDKTMGIFDGKFFSGLKKGSYFISVGRGRSTDTDALMAALRDGTLAGAGLDVTDPEPLPPGHPLWSIPNVIITPHNSSTSDRAAERRWVVIRENIRRYINGEKMLNVVDIERGY
jgi:phosphoglycerate dehydrogenase-like enzyme